MGFLIKQSKRQILVKKWGERDGYNFSACKSWTTFEAGNRLFCYPLGGSSVVMKIFIAFRVANNNSESYLPNRNVLCIIKCSTTQVFNYQDF